jgi:N-terminal acetyltransferase B complex non-catalytic subunit
VSDICTDNKCRKDNYKILVKDYTTKRQLRGRAAQLTRLKDLRATTEENIPYADMLIACTQYYRFYKDKSFCFEDLKDSLESLDEFHRKDFCTFLEEEISQKASIYNRLFKLKYDRLIAPTNEDEPAILDRAARALELYNSSRAESTPCPEASLIAALDILLAATLHSPPNTSYIVRAVLLLSMSLTHLEDYYPYSILLMHCYINLGLLSLAIETFVKLSIKNLQWENVGHLLLTRISSLHPSQHGKGESFLNPSGALDAGLVMLERSTDALNKGIREGLKNGSYSNIIDSVKLRQDFERSVNRQIYALEDSKISRLMGEVDADDRTVVVRAQEPVDKRVFSFLPKYIKADDRVYDALRTGPLPEAAWVDAMAMVQCLMTSLKDDSSDAPGKYRLNEFVILAGPPQRIKPALTVSEWQLYEAGMLVQAIVQSTIKGDEVSETVHRMTHNLEALVEQNDKRGSEEGEEGVEGCVRGISGEVGLMVPGWEYLHASFVQFELGYLVNAFVGRHARQGKGKGKKAASSAALAGLKPEDIQHLKKVLADLETSVKESAKKVKKGLNEGGVLGTLVDIALARNEQGERNKEGEGWKAWSEGMGKMYTDEAEVENMVGRWMESWEDACEGVGAVKMKLGR